MIRAAILCALIAAPAAAQQARCLPLPFVIELLADLWGESPAVRARLADSGVVTVWTNAETQTWTLTVTRADGLTCFVGSGIGIETIAAALPPNI